MPLRAVDLQKLCKQFKLVYSGTKAQTIERLDNYFKSIQNNQSRESESDFESDSEFEEIQLLSRQNGGETLYENKQSFSSSRKLVAAHQKLVEIPLKFKNVPLAQKKRLVGLQKLKKL
ncbi:hypothetical protein BpHYR1_037882 [Brachionus plicatilis]|uniref:SAP domain-containing protein n=1 Tax=Brachionus plicatilis TaxID=10195 RepID=A0A3M7RI69_BRAPC|nr:hypothetical protein BpHYR1_037882 [Brachionus plicatilis]